MTKNDLVEKICLATEFSKKESYEIIDGVLDFMKSTLEKGEDIKIHGFGNFVLKDKAARRGRNPQTGEGIDIGARRILSFKPSKLLRDAINSDD